MRITTDNQGLCFCLGRFGYPVPRPMSGMHVTPCECMYMHVTACICMSLHVIIYMHCSCCVVVKNIERCLYFLPREKRRGKSGQPTEEDVTFESLYRVSTSNVASGTCAWRVVHVHTCARLVVHFGNHTHTGSELSLC